MHEIVLTKREKEIMYGLAHGLSTRQIAYFLFRSPKTVETYHTSLKRKLGLQSMEQLRSYAARHFKELALPQRVEEVRNLKWSRSQQGTWNGKVGHLTLFIVAWHRDEHCYFVHPKVPGFKAVTVKSEDEGKKIAEKLYKEFRAILGGE